MSVTGPVALVIVSVCLLFSITDVFRRRIYNLHVAFVFGFCVVAWLGGALPFSWTAVLLAGVLCLLGDLPGGDVKGVMLLAGLLGVERTVAVFAAALVIAIFPFALYRLGKLPYPGTWPLFPFFAVPACVIVLARL